MKRRGSASDPLWFKDAIIYETHVKAFLDSTNDGIGDFRGLVQKLDHIQDLGATCVWLLPFFPSPLRDDGYDIADYLNVHPSYGTLEDFKAFLNAAHDRGLQVVIELVINHTSDQHPWFQAARKAPAGSPDRAFYVWSDTDQKYTDARIIFTDTEKSNWTWDPEAKAYFWHRFFPHQPDLNFDNPAVVQKVIEAMRFWLDMGVDGLRLDAVPYLCEREATTCENLPDTHAVIKQIRRELEAHYAHRMLLAEANQWPTDVRPYFGEGDECHMAYHFPLMPRIFMALRLEDRHPITEIMTETPPIPDVCQWALFLRNHDELTLEMVTDEERDYMYFAYSADPQARLNVGIRRRLAPLMDNNRRRIELLNSLLLSFPGTPIIYYGDEIGMGDNIYLGDRNGVRTPMQWSADRNAGFSRANPSQLYSPVIMDPIYGYEAVNVEAQQHDPSSLLAWMRNMIALRKLFKVFGRGSIEFLHPTNRKVLAYVRRYEDDQVLCVANLSRFAQAVELDLSRCSGMVPVEMLGYTEFPRIGELPYLLTAGPYGFYWFELQGAPAPIPVPTVTVEDDRELVRLAADGTWSSFFEGRTRTLLETRLLPAFLPKQRWFGGKARTIDRVRIVDEGMLVSEPAPSWLLVVDVTYTDGETEAYTLPVAVATGPTAAELERTRPEAVLARAGGRLETGVLYDAMSDDTTCHALLAAMEHGRALKTRQGVLRATHTRVFARVRGRSRKPFSVGRPHAEQSNTSVLYGDRLIFKLFRRLQPGPNPDFEIARYLTEQTPFDRMPKLAGAIEYARDGFDGTLGMLQELIPNQGDGWKWMLGELHQYFERVMGLDVQPPIDAATASLVELAETTAPDLARDTIGLALDAAATLGRRTAELHLTLAAATLDPAFAAEPLTAEDFSVLSDELWEHATRVFDDLKTHLPSLQDDVVDKAALALSLRRPIVNRLRAIADANVHATKTRIHGDYHLGQVLVVENDFVIIDFEGEPTRSLAERQAKQPPLKDVAGMLRSFSYAVHAAVIAATSRRGVDAAKIEPWARLWERWVSATFLKTYRDTTGAAAFVPSDPAQFARLLDVFLLDKALYELHYEMNNRPAWLRIPLAGIITLAEN